MKRVFGIFKVKKEERWLAFAMLIYAIVLNGLVVYKYFDRFSQIATDYHRLFVRTFHISGFDPLYPSGALSTISIATLCWRFSCLFLIRSTKV